MTRKIKSGQSEEKVCILHWGYEDGHLISEVEEELSAIEEVHDLGQTSGRCKLEIERKEMIPIGKTR